MDTLRLVGLMLERQGYEVLAAEGGHKALKIAKSERLELVLLDVMMPDIDGFEVTRQLRNNPSTADLPIIMFTAKTQMEDKLLGFDVGADDYLTKPTQPRELFAHVKAVLARTSKPRDVIPDKERGYMIGALSSKGGLGVTTLVLNLGIAIHQNTKSDVIVAEFRPGQGSLGLELGALQAEGLTRLLERKASEITAQNIEVELIPHDSGIRLLLSSLQPSDAQYLCAVNTFDTITSHLPRLARYIVLDLGPGLTPITNKTINHCDDIIVVAEPVPHTVLQTKLLIQEIIKSGISEGRLKVVLVNRLRSSTLLSWSQVQDQLGYNITTVFTPAPELAYQAATHNIPIVVQQPDSLTTEQFFKLADKVTQRSR
jgi:pilus assembly protein CpaE